MVAESKSSVVGEQVSEVISQIISCVRSKVFEKVLSKTVRETIPKSELGNSESLKDKISLLLQSL